MPSHRQHSSTRPTQARSTSARYHGAQCFQEAASTHPHTHLARTLPHPHTVLKSLPVLLLALRAAGGPGRAVGSVPAEQPCRHGRTSRDCHCRPGRSSRRCRCACGRRPCPGDGERCSAVSLGMGFPCLTFLIAACSDARWTPRCHRCQGVELLPIYVYGCVL